MEPNPIVVQLPVRIFNQDPATLRMQPYETSTMMGTYTRQLESKD